MKNQFNFKKNSLSVFIILCLIFAVFSSTESNQGIASASMVGGSGGEEEFIDIPVNFGTKGCVCKGTTCQDQNWISFREYCGYGDGTDSTCGIVHGGQCDDND